MATLPNPQTPEQAIALARQAGGGSALSIDGSLFSQAQAQQGAGQISGITIPIFRKYKKGTGHQVIGPNGLTAAERGRYRHMDDDKFDEAGARDQFGAILADRDKLRQWTDIALKAGLISPDNAHDANALGQAWDRAVGWALRISAATGGRTELTPFEAAQMVGENTGSAILAKQNFAAERARLAEETFTGTKTSKRSQTNLSAEISPESALRDLLGRKPTKGEMAAYTHGVQEVAKKHPLTENVESRFEKGQKVEETVTVGGGFDVKAAQDDAARGATPEVAMMQNASTYYNALLQALGPAV
jgi:hypothetical protein